VLLEPDLQHLPFGFHRPERRAPRRIAGLGRRQLELRAEGERLAELVAAGAGAPRRAVDEGEVLEGAGALVVAQLLAERGFEALARRRIIAVVVLLQPGAQRRGALARLEEALHAAHRVGAAAGQGEDERDGGEAGHHLNRWRI